MKLAISFFIKELLGILYIILFILVLLFFAFLRLAWLRELYVVFYDFISKDDSLIRSSYPWGFRFYLYGGHIELFEDFLLEFRCYIWFLNIRQAEEDSCPDRCLERQNCFWENRAKPILDGERHELSLFKSILIGISKGIFRFLLNQWYESWKFFFYFTLRHHL